MATVEGSPGTDRMDWTPTKETILYPNAPKLASQRRKFDEIVDATVPYGRDDVSIQPYEYQRMQEYEYQRCGPYGNDSNMGIIPRYARRLAIWTYGVTYFAVIAAVAAVGIPFEYTASGIKRRLVGKTQERAADARATTPRGRKYRNIYLTPRQKYEQRSARSLKIRDIPGRFPGIPLNTYSPNPSTRLPTPRTTPIPTMHQMPCHYPDSPLHQKHERRLSEKKTMLQQATIYAVVQAQQTAAEAEKAPTEGIQNEIHHWPPLARWEDISELEEPEAQKLYNQKTPPLARWEDISELEELEEPEGPYDPTKDPALAIAPGVREYGQTFKDEAPIMRQIPKPELPSTELPVPTTTQALLSLGPGPLNARLSKPKQGLQSLKSPRLSKITKKPRSALSSKVRVRVNEPGLSSQSTGGGEPSVDSKERKTGDIAIEKDTVSPNETGSSLQPARDGEFSVDSEGRNNSNPMTKNATQTYVSTSETGLSSHPANDGELSIDSSGEQGHSENVSNKSSSSSLYGLFEYLEVAPPISPRRTSVRQQKVVEKEAIEQAAREKKEAEERAQREKEDAELRAQLEREHEEYLVSQGVRRFTKEPIIPPLTREQSEKLNKAMAKGQKVTALNGTELTSRDWKTILEPDAWLNDNIIVAYLEYVVKMAHERAGLKRNAPPKMHAFNNNFFNNLRSQGHKGVARWTRKPKIQGKALLPLEYIFIPVNTSGNHWTLAVISPIRRTIEYFDSLHIPGQPEKVIKLMKVWLKGELGDAYKPEEWTVRKDQGPHQGNFSDCGVHTVTTAKMIALGVDPMSAPAEVMATQRRRIVAELLNSGFHGEFEVDFEYA